MELSTVNPRKFSFESTLTTEACNGLEKLGLLERKLRKLIMISFVYTCIRFGFFNSS